MVSILGPDGQPIARTNLQEPQTARYAMLHHEFAQHPSRGLTPSRLASILDDAEHYNITSQCELFEDMEEKDAHIYAEMGKRRRALLSLEWDILPPTNASAREKKAADQVKELVTEIDGFEDLLFDTTDAIGKGYACQEIEWHRVEGLWLPKTVTHRPQSWFKLYRGFRQEIRLRDNSIDGEVLNPFGWIQHVHRAKSGYIERAALYRVLVWPYLFKNYSVGDLAEFLEIYGIPARIGKYPPCASEPEKTSLLRALVNIGHNAAGMIPEGMKIDFEDAATGDPKAFELMIDWCERSASKAILGATLTSQADRGSNTNALGNVHNEVRKDLRDGDARQVQSTLSRDLIYAIAALNGLAPDGPRRSPRFRISIEEPEDIKLYSDALPKLVKMGMRIGRDWAQEKLGIPEPEEGDDILANGAPVVTPPGAMEDQPLPGTKPGAVAAAKAQLRAAAKADPTLAIAALLERQADPAMSALVDQVRGLLESTDSLETFRDRLLDLAGTMPVDQLATLMGDALLAADLMGRADVDVDQDPA